MTDRVNGTPTAEKPPEQPAAPRRKWLRRVLLAVGILSGLFALAIAILLLIFNDAWFKAQIEAALKEALGREATTETVQVSFWNGTLEIRKLRIANASDKFKDPDTLRCQQVKAEIGLWRLLASSATRLRALKVEIQKPEFILERRGVYPIDEMLNVDDILKKFSSDPPGKWPRHTGLRELDLEFALHDGVITFTDSSTKLGHSRMEQIEVSARMSGLGQPLTGSVKGVLMTPKRPSGRVNLDGAITWIDSAGIVDPAAFSDIALTTTLKDFDIPLLARYARVSGKLSGGKYRWALGEPFNGEITVSGKSTAGIACSANLETAGVISLYKAGEFVAGELPGSLQIEAEFGLAGGVWRQGSAKANFFVLGQGGNLANAAAPRLLDFAFNAGPQAADGRTYTLTLKTINELFVNRMAEVLELQGRCGGALEAQAEARVLPGGRLKIVGSAQTHDQYVVVGNVKNPTSLALNFDTNAKLDERGLPDEAEINFLLKAGSSQIGSRQPVKLSSLSSPEKLSADANLHVEVRGREFWNEFGPLLALAGLDKPLTEALDGEFQIAGRPGSLCADLNCTLSQQTPSVSPPFEGGENKAMPAPFRLRVTADYDGAALADAAGKPYANFAAQLSSSDKTISIKLKGSVTRDQLQQIWDVPEYQAVGDLTALNQLNQRFGAYLEVFFGAAYTLAGTINQTGKSRLVQALAADGKVTGRHLSLSTDIELTPFALRGPNRMRPGTELVWEEKENAKVSVSLALKENGGASTLALKPFSLKSSLLSLEGELNETDLGKLTAAARAEPASLRLWLEALPLLQLEGTLTAEAIRRMQVIGLLPPEELAYGDCLLKVSYDPQTRRANLPSMRFRSPQLDLKCSASNIDAAGLATLGETANPTAVQAVQLLPEFSLQATARAAVIRRLQAAFDGYFKRTPALAVFADPSWQGDVALQTGYDSAKKQLRVDAFTVASPALEASLTAPAVDLNALVTSSLLSSLPEAQLEAKLHTPLFEALRASGSVPQDLVVTGDYALKARYEKDKDRLTLDSNFARGAQGNCPLVALQANFGVQVARLHEAVQRIQEAPAPGPADIAALLACFDNGITVSQLALNPTELCRLLCQRKIAPEITGPALADVYRLINPWVLQNVALRPTATAGVFDLSLNGNTQAYLHSGPPSVPRQVVHALVGNWRIDPAAPLRVNLNAGQLGAQGSVVLDGAGLYSIAAAPYFVYNKELNQPCKLTLALAQDAAGTLRAPSLQLTGGPVSCTAANLACRPAPLLLTLEKLTVGDGAQSATVTGLAYDVAQDKLRLGVEVGGFDVGKVTPYMSLPAGVKIVGACTGAKAFYDGSLAALLSGKAFAGNDKFDLKVGANLRVEAVTPRESANMNLAGDIELGNASVSWKNLNVGVEHIPAGGAPGRTALWGSVDVTPKAAGTSLLNALKAPGLPLLVKAPLKGSGLNIDVVDAISAVTRLFSTGSSGGGGLNGIRDLRLEASLSVPHLLAGGIGVANVEVPALVLDNLIVTIPNAKCAAYGGELALAEARYNIGKEPLAHSQKLSVTNLDLAQIAKAFSGGKAPKPEEYQVSGRLTASGSLSGGGFDAADRDTWRGSAKVTLTDLAATKSEGKAAPPDQSQLQKAFTSLGLPFERDNFFVRWADIYADDFGLFLKRLDFEPLEVNLGLDLGKVSIAHGKIAGRPATPSAGLNLEYQGGISLRTESFAPQLTLWLMSLPPRTLEKLRLNQLTDAERAPILARFEQRQFVPIILKGRVADCTCDNWLKLVAEFIKLDAEIDRLIRAKQPATPPTQPNQPNPPPPPPAPIESVKETVKEKVKEKVKDKLGDWLDGLGL